MHTTKIANGSSLHSTFTIQHNIIPHTNFPYHFFSLMTALQNKGADRVKSYDAFVAASELC